MSQDLEEAFGRAVNYYLSNKLEKAKKNCQKILKRYPKHAEANSLLASIYQKLELYELALKHARQAVMTQPDYVQGWYNLGYIYNKQKDFEGAKAAYLKTLELSPENSEAWYGLGNAYRKLDNNEAAIEAYEKALALNPNLAKAYNNLGQAYRATKQEDQAQQYYEKAIAIDPNYAEAYYNLGRLLNSQQHWEEAANAHSKALTLKPDYAEVHLDMGEAFLNRNLEDKAFKAARSAIDADPNHAGAYDYFANLMINRDIGLSIENARKAISIKPDFAPAYTTLARALTNLGQQEAAIKAHEKAISIDPDSPMRYYGLADTQKTFGEIDAAKVNYRKAIDNGINNPNLVSETFASLTRIYKYKEHDEISHQMVALYAEHSLPPKQQTALAFGLSRLFEGLGDYDKAFQYLSEANQIKRNTLEYTTKETQQQFEQIKTTFKSIQQRTIDPVSTGTNAPQPVFILGMPRSATTLIEQILASHPTVTGAGELPFLHDAILNNQSQTFTQAYKLLGSPNSQPLIDIGHRYLASLEKLHGSNQVITDKMPQNFQHIGLIKTLWPKAKIIHCIRRPVDNCLAIYRQSFAGPHPYAYNLQELAQYYLLYQDLMNFWHKQFPGEIHDIHYEELVANQEEQTRQLLAFCNLPWDENCLQFHKTERAVHTASAIQVRKPIYKDALILADRYAEHLLPLREILDSK